MDDTNVERASKLDTTSLSDALDRLGIAGQCLNIKPLDHGFRLTGRAFTILYGPAGTRLAPSATISMMSRQAASWCSTTAAARTRPCGATS